jgi:hypothetical protein
MTIKIYSDRIDIGDFTLFEGGGGVQFDGVARAENFLGNQGFQGSVAGYTAGGMGGSPPHTPQNTIDKFPFATDSNATDVGDLTGVRSGLTGNSSQTSGYANGGNPGTNTIQKFPFATNTNATNIGTLLTQISGGASGQSSSTHGYLSGGSIPSVGKTNTIQKFLFATDSNATDVGDATTDFQLKAGQSSTVYGYMTGGYYSPDITPNYRNIIEKFPFATDSNATDVGDITVLRRAQAGQSSTVNGYTTSGYKGPPENVYYNTIEKFPFSTDTNATDIGDLTRLVGFSTGQSSTVSGYTTGGAGSSPAQNIIDKFPFATDTNATDVGDLTQGRYSLAGNQV